jgi:hypothetical protein
MTTPTFDGNDEDARRSMTPDNNDVKTTMIDLLCYEHNDLTTLD